MDKQYENELLHEIDDLQRQVKALEEENVKLRSSTPIIANIEVNPNEIEEIKNKIKVVYKALELACIKIKEEHSILSEFNFNLKDYYMNKATSEIASQEVKTTLIEEEW